MSSQPAIDEFFDPVIDLIAEMHCDHGTWWMVCLFEKNSENIVESNPFVYSNRLWPELDEKGILIGRRVRYIFAQQEIGTIVFNKYCRSVMHDNTWNFSVVPPATLEKMTIHATGRTVNIDHDKDDRGPYNYAGLPFREYPWMQ